MAVAGSSIHCNPIRSAPSWSAAPVAVTGPGIKRGPNAAAYISTGIPDLDGTAVPSLCVWWFGLESSLGGGI